MCFRYDSANGNEFGCVWQVIISLFAKHFSEWFKLWKSVSLSVQVCRTVHQVEIPLSFRLFFFPFPIKAIAQKIYRHCQIDGRFIA